MFVMLSNWRFQTKTVRPVSVRKLKRISNKYSKTNYVTKGDIKTKNKS